VQFLVRPPAELAGLAGELVLDELVVLAGGADPAAAHFSLPDHLGNEKVRNLLTSAHLDTSGRVHNNC